MSTEVAVSIKGSVSSSARSVEKRLTIKVESSKTTAEFVIVEESLRVKSYVMLQVSGKMEKATNVVSYCA